MISVERRKKLSFSWDGEGTSAVPLEEAITWLGWLRRIYLSLDEARIRSCSQSGALQYVYIESFSFLSKLQISDGDVPEQEQIGSSIATSGAMSIN